MAVDTGGSNVVPTITIEDADSEKPNGAAADPSSRANQNTEDHPAPLGAYPSGPAPPIPDWYKVGWRQMSGIDDAPLPEGEEKDKGVLDRFLAEQFYGSWYHNAALIIFVRPRLALQSA